MYVYVGTYHSSFFFLSWISLDSTDYPFNITHKSKSKLFNAQISDMYKEFDLYLDKFVRFVRQLPIGKGFAANRHSFRAVDLGLSSL